MTLMAVADEDARLERVSAVTGQLNALHAELVALVAATTEDELSAGGYRSAGQFVCHRTGMSRARAGSIVRIAARHRELPTCWSAFTTGRMSLDQMDAIARHAAAHLDAEACELAASMSPAQLTHVLSKHRSGADPVSEEPADDTDCDERREARGTSLHWDDGGDLVLRARLDVGAGAQVDAALTAHHDALFHEWSRARTDAEKAGRSFAQPMPTWTDALVRMADRSLAADAVDRPHHRRLLALLHVDVDAPHARVHLGPAVGPAVRRWMTCDATYRTVYERDGVPIGIGRTSRTIPERTRMLVEDRDGGCRAPGCGARLVQIHHVHHWEDGGATDTANLIALCPAHHRAHHQGRLGVHGSDADRLDGITFTRADGTPLHGVSPPTPPEERPPPPAERYPGVDGGRADLRWLALPEPSPPSTG